MAEKWTKTSSPDWRWMNPKPLLALNHFTVPCSLTYLLTFILSYLCFSTASSRKAKEAASVNLQPLQSNLKVLQEQQTQAKNSMFRATGLGEFSRLLEAIRFQFTAASLDTMACVVGNFFSSHAHSCCGW